MMDMTTSKDTESFSDINIIVDDVTSAVTKSLYEETNKLQKEHDDRMEKWKENKKEKFQNDIEQISDKSDMTEKEAEKQRVFKDNIQHQQKPTWHHYLIAVIVVLIIFGNIALTIAEEQYGYYAIQRQRNISSVVSASKQSLCEVNKSSNSYKEQQNIQSETADWYAYCNLATMLPALMMSLLVGSWSDRIGRRLALFIPTVGIILKSAFMAIAIHFEWNVYILIIAFFIPGLSGTWITILTISYSYAADLTKYGKNRTFGLVLMEIPLGIGVTMGAIGSGYMIKYIGFLYGVTIICGITSIGALLVFFLPESVQKTEKLRGISQKQYLINALEFYFKKGILRWKFQILAIVFALSELANLGRNSVYQLYVMNSPFCWSSLKIGFFTAGLNFAQMIIGPILSRPLRKFMSERTMCIVGTISAIGFYILTTIATNDVMLYFTPVIGIIGNYPLTMVRAILSDMTVKEKQGTLFGGLGAIDALFTLIGSVFSNFIYAETVSIFRGIIMIIFISCHLIALTLLIFLACPMLCFWACEAVMIVIHYLRGIGRENTY